MSTPSQPGQCADLSFPDSPLRFRVKLLSVKRSYGKTRWLVTPVTGSGEATVDASRLSEIKTEQP